MVLIEKVADSCSSWIVFVAWSESKSKGDEGYVTPMASFDTLILGLLKIVT